MTQLLLLYLLTVIIQGKERFYVCR